MDEERKINWLGLFIKIIIVFIFLLIIIWLVSKIAGSKKLSDTFKKNIAMCKQHGGVFCPFPIHSCRKEQ